MAEKVDRRTFLGTAAAAGAGAIVSGALPAGALAGDEHAPFVHGVASGDPLADRVMLWTRVTVPDGQPIEVGWRVALDPEMRRVVRSGSVVTDAERDHTVKVDVDGLEPGATYFYGFRARGQRSVTGRTRTAPVGDVGRLRIGMVSCSRTWSGYFNAYARIAERSDLDVILHCGDYIYDEPNPREMVRPPENRQQASIPETLDEYRARYALYRLDADLRRAHQEHPWVITWDNHEFGNGDVWCCGGAGEEPNSPAWFARKARAIQAFLEWTPTRPPDPRQDQRIWRQLPYGDLLDLIVLDTRAWGRDMPLGEQFTTIGEEQLNDPSRTILGQDQYAWLTERMQGSQARWRLLLNQVLMAQWNAGGTPTLDGVADIDLVPLREGGNAINPIAWDGYGPERERLFDFLEREGIGDNVVVSGDLHCSFACDLTKDPYDPTRYDRATGRGTVGVEFLPTSVSSGNFDEMGTVQAQPGVTEGLSVATYADNPHIHLAEYEEHGYGILDVTPERVVGEFWWVPIRERSEEQRFGAAFQTRHGEDHLRPVLEPTSPQEREPRRGRPDGRGRRRPGDRGRPEDRGQERP